MRTGRGRTARGRARAQRQIELARAGSRPLLRGHDQGEPIVVRSEHVGAGKRNDRWVQPFLDANRDALQRLRLRWEVTYTDELVVRLFPANRIGAVPLLSPATRKVAAGVLVTPRFQWSALADVVGRIGFAIEPRVGGGVLVPGSARDVPPWLIAGPVLRRIEALLQRRSRTFLPREELRASPRGRVDWGRYVQGSVAKGRWHQLPCTFSEPETDPLLLANVRWTLERVEESLAAVAPSPIGRHLLMLAEQLTHQAGAGPRVRPVATAAAPLAGEIVTNAMAAMQWVSDERGLGGARTLDGLPWDLAIDSLWESWVAHFAAAVGRSMGFIVRSGDRTRQSLDWRGPIRSMRALQPDVELSTAERTIWIDAKYKSHLYQLRHTEWSSLGETVRDSHRADLHQALAYAAIANVDQVDTVLAYPVAPDAEPEPSASVARVSSGARRARIFLVGIPFGFRAPSIEQRTVDAWRDMLRAP